MISRSWVTDSLWQLTPTIRFSPFSSATWYWKAASAISDMNQPCSIPWSSPRVIGSLPSRAAAANPSTLSWVSVEPPIERILSKIWLASASIRSVSASTYQLPPNGSATLTTPVSSMITCWVRKAISAACSLGSASVSSRALVWSELVPPSTAESASMPVRTTLL